MREGSIGITAMNTFEDIPPHLVKFFSGEILALYATQPDKYTIETDYFSGEINTAERHYTAVAESTGTNIIGVKFGFRTRKDGDLALAVWMPDLKRCSSDELMKWTGFSLEKDSFSVGPDARFEMWFQRYMKGSWDVDNGVVARIKDQVREANAITLTTVGTPLFKFEELAQLRFPMAQNNYMYHDAHSEVYKLLIDGLDKNTLVALANKLGIPLTNPGSARTLAILRAILPQILHDQCFPAFDLVSENRRLAAHQNRPSPERMQAFEQFNTDLTRLEVALDLIKTQLAASLKVTVKSCVERRGMMSMVPTFDPEMKIEPNYSICGISKIEGKKISRVEYGWRKSDPRVHDSELIILHFDDGSSIAIRTGSNFMNLSNDDNGLKPNDLHVSFLLDFVPPLESAT